jgi:hypothetical protein
MNLTASVRMRYICCPVTEMFRLLYVVFHGCYNAVRPCVLSAAIYYDTDLTK